MLQQYRIVPYYLGLSRRDNRRGSHDGLPIDVIANVARKLGGLQKAAGEVGRRSDHHRTGWKIKRAAIFVVDTKIRGFTLALSYNGRGFILQSRVKSLRRCVWSEGVALLEKLSVVSGWLEAAERLNARACSTLGAPPSLWSRDQATEARTRCRCKIIEDAVRGSTD